MQSRRGRSLKAVGVCLSILLGDVLLSPVVSAVAEARVAIPEPPALKGEPPGNGPASTGESAPLAVPAKPPVYIEPSPVSPTGIGTCSRASPEGGCGVGSCAATGSRGVGL